MSEKTKIRKSVSKEDFKDALMRKALGYDCTETVEEYVSSDEGEIRLLKKKVTKKNVPPDITALKILLEDTDKNVESMTDDELEIERERLMEILKNSKKEKTCRTLKQTSKRKLKKLQRKSVTKNS